MEHMFYKLFYPIFKLNHVCLIGELWKLNSTVTQHTRGDRKASLSCETPDSFICVFVKYITAGKIKQAWPAVDLCVHIEAIYALA